MSETEPSLESLRAEGVQHHDPVRFRYLEVLAGRLPAWRNALLGGFMKTLVLGVNPVWMPEATMRFAALAHARRGGQVLTLFWHSSELLPGGSPHFPDQTAVDAFLAADTVVIGAPMYNFGIPHQL